MTRDELESIIKKYHISDGVRILESVCESDELVIDRHENGGYECYYSERGIKQGYKYHSSLSSAYEDLASRIIDMFSTYMK